MANVTTDNIREEEIMRRRGEGSFKKERALIILGSEGLSSRVRSPHRGTRNSRLMMKNTQNEGGQGE